MILFRFITREEIPTRGSCHSGGLFGRTGSLPTDREGTDGSGDWSSRYICVCMYVCVYVCMYVCVYSECFLTAVNNVGISYEHAEFFTNVSDDVSCSYIIDNSVFNVRCFFLLLSC